ncbi:hypothetical protein JM84_1554 [Dokdonia sp. Hel_I_63]|uniref:hypothetical protein n=1 Tax=Dokdonia sp. Hel_I_63 TaxID=1249996 RepID=UPI00119AB4D5|nr:hypothetical protein [Dokdonia sp. Hel_I_63]TVZ22648.1 hypothetical protein JM84_1554 [Dokdonia sp. Hel_I_63]
MIKKAFEYLLIILIITVVTGCSSDDNCPDQLTINIDDPESIERAEECGLSPAEPLGESLWIYKIQ